MLSLHSLTKQFAHLAEHGPEALFHLEDFAETVFYHRGELQEAQRVPGRRCVEHNAGEIHVFDEPENR